MLFASFYTIGGLWAFVGCLVTVWLINEKEQEETIQELRRLLEKEETE